MTRSERAARRARTRRRLWLAAFLALACWAAAAAFLVGSAANDARQGEQALTSVRDRYTAEDLLSGEARDEIDAARGRFARAADRAASPVLVPARALPFVGRQLHSLRSLTAAGEVVLTSAMAVSVTLDETADRDPGPAGRVAAAAEVRVAVARATGELEAVDLGPSRSLVSPLAEARDVLDEELTDAIDAGGRATAIAGGLEQLLRGGRYVVLASNNAEMQAGWGMPLSVGLLEVTDGQLELSDMRPSWSAFVAPDAVPVTGDLAAHWAAARPTEDWRNLALTPHFQEAAPLAAAMWEANGGGPVDGVLALDPLALAAILEATGPVDAEGREVDAAGVVRYSLHDSYVEQEQIDEENQQQRRERQSAIAEAAVQAISRPEVELRDLVVSLADAAAGRHILLWSQQAAQQAGWEAAGVDGSLEPSSLLLALVNRGGNKLDWFTDVDAVLTTTPSSEGTDVALEVTMHNRVPDGEPRYIAGPHNGRTSAPELGAGDWGGHLAMYLPDEALHARIDGVEGLSAVGPSGPTQLLAAPIVVRKGESETYTVRFTLPPGAGTVVIEPSARVNSVEWLAEGERWKDDRARTLDLEPSGPRT